MKLGWQPRKWLEKKAKRGMRGHPVGTIAFYGPDNRRATKAAVNIGMAPQSEPAELRRWFAERATCERTRRSWPRSPHSSAGARRRPWL